jgi:hypothetical protein
LNKRNFSIISLALLLLCSFLFVFEVQLKEVKAQTVSIVINDGDTFTASPSVTLTIYGVDSPSLTVIAVRYSNDDSNRAWNEATVESFSSTKEWTLLPDDGVKTVYYQIWWVGDFYFGQSYSDSITLDTISPTGSIVINDGAAFADSSSVTLTLTTEDLGSGVDQVRFSNSGNWDPDTGGWESFSFTETWSLSPGDGGKTVYCQVKDSAGNPSVLFSDTIVLDTAAPTGSIMINGGDQFTNSSSATLTLIADDQGSGVNQVRYSNDGIWDSENWESFSSTKSWPLLSGDGQKTIHYQIGDYAGLESTFSDTIVLDTLPPTGSIKINTDDESTTSNSVTLQLTANDTTSGIYKVRYSNDGVWDVESWEDFSSTKAWTLSSDLGSKTVYYQIMDRAQQISTFSDTIILATPPPSPTPTPTPTPIPTPTPTPTSSSPPTPTPTVSPSVSPSPSESPIPSSEPWDGTRGVIPPEAFYATALIGLASIAAIILVTFRKSKNKENPDSPVNLPSPP